MPIVYKLTSPSNKIYIGQTIQKFNERLREHKNTSKNNKIKTKICIAIRKYPLDNWKKQIIFEGTNEEALLKEIEFIKFFDTIKNGYNITEGGDVGSKGYIY